MADGGGMMPAYPQVFVVDSQAPCVPGPMPEYPRTRGATWRQRLLFVLVGLALLGVLIEAYCIYNLQQKHNEGSNSTPEKVQSQTQDLSNEITIEPKKPEKEMKPAALLIASQLPQGKGKRSTTDETLLWTKEGDGFLQEMDYKNGSLTVKKEGIYFLYTKVALQDSQCAVVKHTVKRISQRYGNGSRPMDLMQSVRYWCLKSQRDKQDVSDMASSYLGGAFHLFANDSIYVTLNVKLKPGNTENFFGAFML